MGSPERILAFDLPAFMTSESAPSVVVIHGTGATPKSNWLPWLASELSKREIKVVCPQLPTPEGQSLENWIRYFHAQIPHLSRQSILVGHSMGAGFILRLLEKSTLPVSGSFLISGWTGLLDNPSFDPLIESFFQAPFSWPKIRENAGALHLYHGDDDPYVPLIFAEKLSANVGTPLTVIQGGKHLNAEAGYLEFPLLLKDILTLLGKTRR